MTDTGFSGDDSEARVGSLVMLHREFVYMPGVSIGVVVSVLTWECPVYVIMWNSHNAFGSSGFPRTFLGSEFRVLVP